MEIATFRDTEFSFWSAEFIGSVGPVCLVSVLVPQGYPHGDIAIHDIIDNKSF